MEQLEKYFKNKNIEFALDVGTGTGDFIKVLHKVLQNVKITGVDPNKESLIEAKEKYPDVDFRGMGAEKLEFQDNSFDVASISMALHHLPEIQKSLMEMQRVVKQGGWIIINELFSDNLNEAQEVHKLFHHFRSTTDRIIGISHNETFKKEEIIKMVKKSGIDVQFNFEFKQETNLISDPKDIDERVEKMKQMLERIKGYPEYESLKPQIEEFRTRILKYGFQPASRVVIVGLVK